MLAKMRADDGTLAAATLQVWFGAGVCHENIERVYYYSALIILVKQQNKKSPGSFLSNKIC